MFEFKEVDYHTAVIFFDDWPLEQVSYGHVKTLRFIRWVLNEIIENRIDIDFPRLVHIWEPLEDKDYFYIVSSFKNKPLLKRLSFEGSANLYISNIDRINEFNSWVNTYGNNAFRR